MTNNPSPEAITSHADEEERIELAGTSEPKPPSTKSSTAPHHDPFLVAFDETHDLDNPLDWPMGKKWMVTDVLSATGFNRIMVSTIMAPALGTISKDLGMNPTEAAMSLSIYLLATAFGPLFIGPLSEMYGRQMVLHGSSIWFLIWNILCGFAKTKETLIASRFLAGFGASAIYSLGGGVLGDIWRPEQRGKSLSIYLLIPLLGAAVGPIIGGFMAGRTTWRWMFWSTSIFQAAMIFVSFFCFPETYGQTILHRKARQLRKETGDTRYYTLAELRDRASSKTQVFVRTISRPVRMLLFHPIIQVASLESGFAYGLLYITLSTFSEIWTGHYGQSVEISGLHYIACSLGEVIGSLGSGYIMDYLFKRHKGGPPRPESRLPLTVPGFMIGWCGVLMYGWTAQYRLHWIVVDVGVVIMLTGMQIGGLPMSGYVIDAYGEHTSSAMAAQQFVRSLTAFCFPLFAPSMYQKMGYGWGNTLLTFVGLLITVPVPLYIWKHGERLRAKAGSTH